MSGIFSTAPVSIIPPNQPSPVPSKAVISQITATAKGLDSESVFQYTARAISNHDNAINQLFQLLRLPLPLPETVSITDPSGKLIAWLGYAVAGGVPYFGGWFKQIYIGGTSPANAPFFADSNGNVFINGATFTLNLNGVTTTIGNISFGGTGHAGLDVKNNTGPSQDIYVTDTGFYIRGTDQSTTVAQLIASGDAGELRLSTVANSKVITLNTAGAGSPIITIADGTNTTRIQSVNVDSPAYSVGGVAGATGNHFYITSLSTVTLFYKDWTGTNQSQVVVTAVNTTALAFTNGLATTA